MPKMLLTAKFTETVRPSAMRVMYSDTRSPNLSLIVQPSGTKTWVWRGRIDKKVTTLTLGSARIHTLANARTWADDHTIRRDSGVPIGQEKGEADVVDRWLATLTCDKVFELHMENDKLAAEDWRYHKERNWRVHVRPVIGEKLAIKVTHDDLMGIVRKVDAHSETAGVHVKALLSRVFKWAVTDGRDLTKMSENPAAYLVRVGKIQKRDRFLSSYEIGVFFRAIEALSDNAFAEPTMMLLYTGVRRDEAFEAEWAEFDLVKGEWLIPKERTKNGDPLLLPLPPVIVGLLQRRMIITGAGKYVWPNKKGGKMSGFSDWKEKLIEKARFFAALDGKDIPNFTFHDLRRTLSTGMNSLRAGRRRLVDKDVVERVLNHRQGGVKGIYDQFDYYEDKLDALRAWADYLGAIRNHVSVPEDREEFINRPAIQHQEALAN